jgi:diketogulonate reductase-like aldo/keto reductase
MVVLVSLTLYLCLLSLSQPKINTDITTTQVAINYVVAKGGVPLVSVNTPKDAQEVLGCLGWSLTEDDVEMLDAAASLCGL